MFGLYELELLIRSQISRREVQEPQGHAPTAGLVLCTHEPQKNEAAIPLRPPRPPRPPRPLPCCRLPRPPSRPACARCPCARSCRAATSRPRDAVKANILPPQRGEHTGACTLQKTQSTYVLVTPYRTAVLLLGSVSRLSLIHISEPTRPY